MAAQMKGFGANAALNYRHTAGQPLNLQEYPRCEFAPNAWTQLARVVRCVRHHRLDQVLAKEQKESSDGAII